MSSQFFLEGASEDAVEQPALSIAVKPPPNCNDDEHNELLVVLPRDPSENVTAVASQLMTVAGVKGSIVHSVTWPAPIPSLKAPPTVVSLLEFNNSFITDLSELDYDALKATVLCGKRLLWVAKGNDPIMQTATGFLRSLNNENPSLECSFLLLEEDSKRDALEAAKMIEQILSTQEIEKEHFERSGILHCSRWAEKRDLSTLVGADKDGSQTASIALSEVQSCLTLTKQESKPASKVVCSTSELADQPLGDNEVEIGVRSLLLT